MLYLFVWFQNQDPIPAGGQVRKVQLVINNDADPEPDELVLVYLTDVQGGARVATDSDSGLQVQKLFTFTSCLIHSVFKICLLLALGFY